MGDDLYIRRIYKKLDEGKPVTQIELAVLQVKEWQKNRPTLRAKKQDEGNKNQKPKLRLVRNDSFNRNSK